MASNVSTVRSLSSTGRTCENTTVARASGNAASPVPQRASTAGDRRRQLKLRPWDGMALVDAVLADARTSATGQREAPITSSPRVNPALQQRDVVEAVEAKAHRFLLDMGTALPAARETPAVLAAESAATRLRKDAASPAVDDDAPAAASPLRPMRGAAPSPAWREHSRLPKPDRSLLNSSCFTAPHRDTREVRRAPAVGQYTPKYSVVERKGGSASMGRARRDIASPTPMSSSSSSPPPFELMRSPSPTAHGKTKLAKSSAESDDADDGSDGPNKRTTRPATGTPAFRSGTPRFPNERHDDPPPPLDTKTVALAVGAKPSTAGTFSMLPRRSAFETQAASVSFREEKRRIVCTVDMARGIARAKQRLRHMVETTERPASALKAVDPAQVLSTKHRTPSPADFAHQASRPATPAQPNRPALEPDVPEHTKGFVDIGRMVYEGERTLVGTPWYGRDAPPMQLNPNPDYVLRNQPRATIARPPRPTSRAGSAMAGEAPASRAASPASFRTPSPQPRRAASAGAAAASGSDDVVRSLDATRRRAPSATMRATSRAAPVMRQSRDRGPDSFYNTDPAPVSAHVPTASIATNLSRNSREQRYASKFKAADTVYDVKAPKPKGGALDFARSPPRSATPAARR